MFLHVFHFLVSKTDELTSYNPPNTHLRGPCIFRGFVFLTPFGIKENGKRNHTPFFQLPPSTRNVIRFMNLFPYSFRRTKCGNKKNGKRKTLYRFPISVFTTCDLYLAIFILTRVAYRVAFSDFLYGTLHRLARMLLAATNHSAH